MITTTKALLGDKIITIYRGLKSDAMPVIADEDDRYLNLDCDTAYVFTDGHWIETVAGQGGGGTMNHNELENRRIPSQHPIQSIEGLEEVLEEIETDVEDVEQSVSGLQSSLSHETWTFTLDDDTTVTKEVVLWTSQE